MNIFDCEHDLKTRVDATMVTDMLSRHGNILFRNTGMSFEDFSSMKSLFVKEPMKYGTFGQLRTELAKNVYTVGKLSDPEDELILHQEKWYENQYPRRIAFLCKSPTEQGGESTLCNLSSMLNELPETTRTKLLNATFTIKYILPSEKLLEDSQKEHVRTWQKAWDTQDEKEAVKKALAQFGKDNFLWIDNDTMQVTTSYKVLNYDQQTKQQKYIMTASMFRKRTKPAKTKGYFSSTWDEDTQFTDEENKLIYDSYQKNKQSILLNKVDILVVDNLQYAHGRLSYQGNRELVVLMGCPQTKDILN